MSEWKEMAFSEAVCINPPVTFEKKDELPFVEMKDIDPSNKFCTWSQKRKLSGGARFQNGDTLFARITPCLENGKIAVVRSLPGGKGFGSTEFHVLRGKEGKTVSSFVYYMSRWKEVRDFAELNLHGTSGRQRFPSVAFNELVLDFPPLPEQERIAEVLSSLDDKIDLLHRQNQTLEQLAETLFRQWFENDSEDETTVHEEFDVMMGQSPPGNTYNESGQGVVFYQGRTDFGFRFPTPRVYCTEPTRYAQEGDTLMSVRAPVGDLNYAEERCCIGRGLSAVRHKNKKYTSHILTIH